jgi:hypothetical protein
MTTRKRVAHTASFLQTFHTGVTTADRREAAGAEGSEPFAAPADAEAIAFVQGRAATFAAPSAPAGNVETIKGWTVRTGDAFISAKQAAWIIDIATTREGVTEAMAESIKVRLEQGFAKFAGSQFITKYKDLPKAIPSAAKMEAIAPGADSIEYARATAPATVPDGRYAIQLPTQDKPHFYRVTAGRKAGIVFVNEQASDETYPVRNPNARKEILAEIAKDVEKAGVAYATLIGSCRRCGRTLTDANNPYLAMGFGPECGSK